MKKTLQVRMSDEEYAGLVERAGGPGKRLSDYCRVILLKTEGRPAMTFTQVKGSDQVARHLARQSERVPGSMCARCTRIGRASCDACLKDEAKLATSATETFGHLETLQGVIKDTLSVLIRSAADSGQT